MNKKIVIITVCVSLAVILLTVGTVLLLKNDYNKGKANKDGMTITVGTAEGKKGDIVKVPVTIKNNTGFAAMLLDFNFDSDCLEYTGYTDGDVIKSYNFNATGNSLKFVCLESEDTSKNGCLFEIEFKILTDKKQNCEIKLNIGENGVGNMNEEYVKVSAQNGKVKIK